MRLDATGGYCQSVLVGVRVMFVKLYCLQVNGQEVCEVTSDVSPLFSTGRSRLPKDWLRRLVSQALREYFGARNKFRSEDVVRA